MSVSQQDVALILVHYHTPDLVAGALAAAHADADRSGLRLECVIVDNGSTEEGRRELASLPARLLEPGENLGYAGGAGLGVAATTAPHLVLANPDVTVLPGCLSALVAELRSGAAAAGPRFFWDREDGFLLPPTERRRRTDEIWSRLARSGEPLRRAAVRRWRGHAYRHWMAVGPIPTRSLSGALLAFTRAAWHRVGPMDTGFRLYFEECDWLARAGGLGLSTRLVPAARAIHSFARSTTREAATAAWFAASERRFARRHYGVAFTRLLAWLDRLPARLLWPSGEIPVGKSVAETPGEWVEISPLVAGFPSAARRTEPGESTLGRLSAARAVATAGLAPGSAFRVQIVSASGVELASFRGPR